MRNSAISLVLALGVLVPAMGHAGSIVTTAIDDPAVPDGLCLKAADIDRTAVPDDKTILFYLKTGQVWRNALVSNCPALSEKGFSYANTPAHGVVCGNFQQIRVNDSGQTCILGQFTRDLAQSPST